MAKKSGKSSQSDPDNWMPLWIGDYVADTMAFQALEHGAYLMCLMHLWRDGPFDDSPRVIQGITKLDSNEMAIAWPLVSQKLTLCDGKWSSKRLTAEKAIAIENRDRVSSARSESGKKGAKARWEKQSDDNPMANAIANGMANGRQTDGSSPSPSPITQPSSSLRSEEGSDPADAEPARMAIAIKPEKPPKPAKAPKEPPPTAEAWEAYSGAYERRYGVEPVRNATVNGQLANLIGKVGKDEAPRLCRHYLSMSNSQYAGRRHDLGLLLLAYQSIRTEMLQAEGHAAPGAPALSGSEAESRAKAQRILARRAAAENGSFNPDDGKTVEM